MSGRHFLRATLPATLRATALGAIAGAGLIGAAQASSPKIINLTQVGCQFIESENGANLGYMPKKKADCVAINGKTGAKRLTAARVLELKPGDYKFRVVNKNVPTTCYVALTK